MVISIICISLLCSSSIFYGLFYNPSIFPDNLIMDASAQVANLTVITKVVGVRGETPPSPADFTINVGGINPSPAEFAGSESGTVVSLNPGEYDVLVRQGAPSSYFQSFSNDCRGTINAGEAKTCTVTNTWVGNVEFTSRLTIVNNVIPRPDQPDAFKVEVMGAPSRAGGTGGKFVITSGSGVQVTLLGGRNYQVVQYFAPEFPSYQATYSADCEGFIGYQEDKTCTITNAAIPSENQGTLVVTNQVINDNRGTATPFDFFIQVNGNNPFPSSFVGSERGEAVQISPGGYNLILSTRRPGYVTTFSGSCDITGAGVIEPGEIERCVITNYDIPSTLNMLAFGDSVLWGQGLLPEQKYHSLVENEIKARYPSININKQVFAHSGAIIGESATHLVWRQYEFRWDEVPGQDSQRLRDYLYNLIRINVRSLYHGYWVTAPVEKVDGGNTIKIGPVNCDTVRGTTFNCKTAYIRLDSSGTRASIRIVAEDSGFGGRDLVFDINTRLLGKYIDGKLTMFADSRLVNNFIFGGGRRYHGEIPSWFPTILTQVEQYRGPPDPNNVNLILLSGCINDVGATTKLLEDQLSHNEIVRDVYNACYTDMKTLLQKVSSKFPNAVIIVTGYFPAISEYTIDPGARHGDRARDFMEIIAEDCNLNFGIVVSHWALFHRDSSALIGRAVQESVDPNNMRIFFADPQFGPENAVFGPDTLLFSFGGEPIPSCPLSPLLSLPDPVDPVAGERKAACDRELLPEYLELLLQYHPLQRLENLKEFVTVKNSCYLASIAHPRADGARQYAQEIIEVLDNGALSSMLRNIPPG
jgi:hypothetical protein